MTAAPTRSSLRRALAAWRDALHVPSCCAVCHAATQGRAGRLCGDCLLRFAPHVSRCQRCAMALPSRQASTCGPCLRNPPPWSHAVAVADYGYPWDGLLSAFKFRAALDLAPSLAASLAQRVASTDSPAIDVVVPVPLAAPRLRERGHNQSAVLAIETGRLLGRTVRPAWLLRTVDTAHQTALPKDQRRANVRNAFAVEPLALPLLRDATVALVDDVLTTGATATEASRVLLAAGARSVQLWVVARTPG